MPRRTRLVVALVTVALGVALGGTAAAADLTFAVYGGSDGNADAHMAVARGIAELSPGFVIHTGNMVAPTVAGPDAADVFDAGARPVTTLCPIRPVLGPESGDSAVFHSLHEAPAGRYYYSFDAGDAHVVVLDTGLSGRRHAKMLEWLREDLAADRSRWKIVACHRPVFGVAGSPELWGADDVLPVLESAGVDVVVAGGARVYERFMPIGPNGEKPIIHLVCGCAGGSPDTAARSPMLAGGYGYADDHFCLFRIDGRELELTMRRPEGSVIDRLHLHKGRGGYQDEIMAAAVPTQRARVLAPLSADLDVRFRPFPGPGESTEMVFSGHRFPEGATVTVRSVEQPAAPAMRGREQPAAPQGRARMARRGWQIEPQTMRAAAQMAVRLMAPENMSAGPGGFSPDLWVRIEVEHRGESYVAEHVHVPLTDEIMAAAVPAPDPVPIPRGPEALFIDGSPDDWAAIRPVPCPYHDGQGGSLKLCWREDGLYGMLVVEDDSVTGNAEMPYAADGLNLFLDRDWSRRVSKRPTATQICMGPAPSRGPGKGNCVITYGGGKPEAARIRTSWRPTVDGWTFEFMVPPDVVAPARLEAGSAFGMNFAVDDDGDHVECFYSNPSDDESWRSPVRWGAVVLAD